VVAGSLKKKRKASDDEKLDKILHEVYKISTNVAELKNAVQYLASQLNNTGTSQ
jgi:uncharacterized protein YoxC